MFYLFYIFVYLIEGMVIKSIVRNNLFEKDCVWVKLVVEILCELKLLEFFK